MKVVSLNNNATMEDILLGLPSGKIKKYILTSDNIERLSGIIRLAYKIGQEKEVYIEVKFNSKYNSRPKRLEIVAKTDNNIEIYKFSKNNNFEKECLDLQRIINEIKPKTDYCLKGYLVFSSFLEKSNEIVKRINEISTNVSLILE